MTKSRTLPPATAAARIAPLLITLAALAIAAGGLWLWRHRRQIAAALVAAVATTYAAGAWGREQIEALAADSARRLPAQPIAALAPITATIAAAWGLVDRSTMARAEQARRARLPDIAFYQVQALYCGSWGSMAVRTNKHTELPEHCHPKVSDRFASCSDAMELLHKVACVSLSVPRVPHRVAKMREVSVGPGQVRFVLANA